MNQYTSGKYDQIGEAIKKYVDGKPWEYFNGFVNTDSRANFKCLNCGNIQSIPFHCFRKKQRTHIPRCKVCEQSRREEAKSKKFNQLMEDRRIFEEQKRIKKLRARPSLKKVQKRLVFNHCRECGTTFLSVNNTAYYCSDQCRRKYKNWRCDHRINKSVIVDKDISLKKLYQKDKGVCYLCGSVCNWNDKQVRNGTIICGESYPSIDHVIPLSKGGKHAWNNVKLACRGCNTKKGNR